MRVRPSVLIPSGSPLVEPVAEAIARGLPRGRAPRAGASVVSSPSFLESKPPAGPIVFVGWQGDLEPSRRLASEILAALAQVRSGACSVALFESSPPDPRLSSTESALSSPKVCHGIRFLGAAERFVVPPDLREYDAHHAELARARRWAARVYGDWRSAAAPFAPRLTDPEPERELPAWSSWCGALE